MILSVHKLESVFNLTFDIFWILEITDFTLKENRLGLSTPLEGAMAVAGLWVVKN